MYLSSVRIILANFFNTCLFVDFCINLRLDTIIIILYTFHLILLHYFVFTMHVVLVVFLCIIIFHSPRYQQLKIN